MKKTLWKKRVKSIMIVLALIFGIVLYTQMSIKTEVNEKQVIVTAQDIPPRTKITKDMLSVHTMPSRGIPVNAVTDPKDIVGKWTVGGYGISKNSFIYKEKIVNQKNLPDAGLLQLKENEVAVPLLVDLETSLGNSIIPNTHIDLYFRNVVTDETDPKALFGKLASQIRVVAVKDAQATNVFDTEANKNSNNEQNSNSDDKKSMAKIYIFAVPDEMSDLINKAKMLGEVIPVATGQTYESSVETTVSKNEVVKFIEDSTFKMKGEIKKS